MRLEADVDVDSITYTLARRWIQEKLPEDDVDLAQATPTVGRVVR